MQEETPSIAYQKRLSYRTDYDEVAYLYRLINYTIFDNELSMPILEVVPNCRKYWGICYADNKKPFYKRSYCRIRLSDKWFCHHWLISTLAHEMCHQYQWDIIGNYRILEGKERMMSHGPSFFYFREELAKNGIALKTAHSQRKWFKHQNLFRC